MKDHNRQQPKRKPPRASFADRFGLWLSTGRDIDGLWIAACESAPYPGLDRVEKALHLIKHCSPLHYSRVIRDLDRVWVTLTETPGGEYRHSLKACVLDERYVLAETTTLERLASTIVHEATHARLEDWGISYQEKIRPRIEAVCLRRELSLAVKLPDSVQLQEELVRSIEFYGPNNEYFSNANSWDRYYEGQIETLRYLGMSERFISTVFKIRSVIVAVRSVVRRLVGQMPVKG